MFCSSGETVTSVASSSPGMHRKEKRHKAPPKDIPVQPPVIPVKGRTSSINPADPKIAHMNPKLWQHLNIKSYELSS